ncbi:MAG: hypothetical protein FWF08_09030, partial [Oscillospiraceae bacterium]|nr:hypothetical protein [Oscillospiraceae bacterium]
LGHDYDPWILAIAPTADAYGVEIRVCNACLKLDYRVVEKLSQGGGDCTHEWEAANCTAPKMCRLCNYIEGAALGHDDGDGDGYCDICGDSLGSHGGLTPFHTCDCCDLHDHSDSFFDRISCFFCKLMQFFRNLFSFSQNAL